MNYKFLSAFIENYCGDTYSVFLTAHLTQNIVNKFN